MDQQRLAERVGLYGLLRTLYAYPLQGPLLETVARLTVEPDSPLAPGLKRMQSALDDGISPDALEALNVEMTRLLEGPGLTPAPPYASYYLHDGLLMGPAAVAARQSYLEWEVVPEGEIRIPDDHITLELGFLAHLAVRAAAGDSDADEALAASQAFIVEQLMPWLPSFCAALRTASHDPFFLGLADFTMAAIKDDRDWLSATLAENAGQAVFAASIQ